MKNVAILGSTGSIGQSALAVVAAHPDKLRVVALAAGQNVSLLNEQARAAGVTRTAIAKDGAQALIDVATHPDARGTVCEIYDEAWDFSEDPLVYVYEITIRPGVTKGWIKHEHQDDQAFEDDHAHCAGRCQAVRQHEAEGDEQPRGRTARCGSERSE